MPVDQDRRKRQRSRNVALLVVLLGFVALLYLITMVRIGGG